MNITVPQAADVGHNPLEVAKPLLILGWHAPAAISARVALEQCLREVVEASGHMPKYPLGIAAIADAIRKNDLLPTKLINKASRYGTSLNGVAHGKPIDLFNASRLIEAIEMHIGDIRRVRGGELCEG